ncbi:sugar phosphatase [Actinomyces viscosus]|uniref:Phosphatase YbjI n=1 Tax=Actinomyces viscosus TaxID=1656 RepID=A0A448PJA0_ACTVI|nr:HAD hydrolase family protein [Actinomyces viscosus]TFH53909.1 sugar phosphatase [Actinomyces viscosus]VEI14953.1 Phosphatase YbjI [Actinomyces viscosus]
MKRLPLEPELLAPLPAEIDLRLVVTDMDGTLIDGEGRVPAGLNRVVDRMREAGIVFVPASGRQLANLRAVLGHIVDDSPIIAESGALVVHGSEEVHSDTISAEDASAAIATARELAGTGYDVGAVVACKRCAYIERSDPAFLDQARLYYGALEIVDDLMAIPLDEVLKVAVFDFADVEDGSSQALTAAVPNVHAMVSGMHWMDMTSPRASKGRALAALQARLGILPEQTAVFGDYLNDLDLYEHADLGFAMRNAHPGIHAAAAFTAPANTEDGVLRTVEELLRRSRPTTG